MVGKQLPLDKKKHLKPNFEFVEHQTNVSFDILVELKSQNFIKKSEFDKSILRNWNDRTSNNSCQTNVL